MSQLQPCDQGSLTQVMGGRSMVLFVRSMPREQARTRLSLAADPHLQPAPLRAQWRAISRSKRPVIPARHQAMYPHECGRDSLRSIGLFRTADSPRADPRRQRAASPSAALPPNKYALAAGSRAAPRHAPRSPMYERIDADPAMRGISPKGEPRRRLGPRSSPRTQPSSAGL